VDIIIIIIDPEAEAEAEAIASRLSQTPQTNLAVLLYQNKDSYSKTTGKLSASIKAPADSFEQPRSAKEDNRTVHSFGRRKIEHVSDYAAT
jgi:hypothetical protein